MKHAVFDADGLPLAFYDEAVHGLRLITIGEVMTPDGDIIPGSTVPNPECLIPDDAVPISDADWSEFIANQGRRRWNGTSVEPVEPVALPIPDGLAATTIYGAIRAALTPTEREALTFRLTGTGGANRALQGLVADALAGLPVTRAELIAAMVAAGVVTAERAAALA